jgi:hypothetical protein
MSRIAEGEAETACSLTREPPRPDPVLRRGIRLAIVRTGFRLAANRRRRDWRPRDVQMA